MLLERGSMLSGAAVRPNIVFLVVESTDGRTWTPGYSNSALALPALRALQEQGTTFLRHYSNTPVCCPSRASFWSGRHAHRIAHVHHGLHVGGVWNNVEGLPANFTDRIDQVLGRSGYDVLMAGKYDWDSSDYGKRVPGHPSSGHSLNVAFNSWTMYTRFPYDINASGGWHDETPDCASDGVVNRTHGANPYAHDWAIVNSSTAWVRARLRAQRTSPTPRPWFAYQGMLIVHPPYVTTGAYFDRIDPAKVSVPAWRPLRELHPCDLQSSMLKGCTPGDADAAPFYDLARRRRIRRIYLAMIEEFSEMVGRYTAAVDEEGATNATVFIVTSDHGDMQMERQQFYKMVPYEASVSVPMVIALPPGLGGAAGGILASPPQRRLVSEPTSLIDLFPTIMQLAGVHPSRWPKGLDGHSLLDLLGTAGGGGDGRLHGGAEDGAILATPGLPAAPSWSRSASRPPYVVSQFHGCNLAASWFMIVQTIGGHAYKLIHWGTGAETPSLLYNLSSDESESLNLLGGGGDGGGGGGGGGGDGVAAAPAPPPSVAAIARTLDANLRAVIPYARVAREVARYNHAQFARWVNVTGPGWVDAIHAKGLRWDASWDVDPAGALAALKQWMASPPDEVLPCRAGLKWPPE